MAPTPRALRSLAWCPYEPGVPVDQTQSLAERCRARDFLDRPSARDGRLRWPPGLQHGSGGQLRRGRCGPSTRPWRGTRRGHGRGRRREGLRRWAERRHSLVQRLRSGHVLLGYGKLRLDLRQLHPDGLLHAACGLRHRGRWRDRLPGRPLLRDLLRNMRSSQRGGADAVARPRRARRRVRRTSRRAPGVEAISERRAGLGGASQEGTNPARAPRWPRLPGRA
jgi:hypothetical protein